MKTKQIVTIAMLAAALCIVAPFAIPLTGGVPISLATLMVMMVGSMLDWKQGVCVVGLYLLLGMVGLPVFSNYSSGLTSILGPTGGYLIGYLPLVICTGMGKEKNHLIIGMLVGTIVLYSVGTLWFMLVMKANLVSALMMCVVPFLLGDVIKMAIVYVVQPILKKVV